MSDKTESKTGLGDVFPDGGGETSWQRTEPLITPAQLLRRHLWGLSLVSGTKNGVTGKADVITPADLIDYIDRAVSDAELDSGLTIFETNYEEKKAFDRAEYMSFGYFRIRRRPITSIEALTINLSDDEDIFIVPNEWIETAYLHKGQINVIPVTVALLSDGTRAVPTTAGGATMLSVLGNRAWVAAFWKITCTIGFPTGQIPKPVNDLIGVIAAMRVLSMLASTYSKSTSSSLSLDGAGQSSSGPGPELFTKRLADLEKDRIRLTQKLKSLFGQKLFSSNV